MKRFMKLLIIVAVVLVIAAVYEDSKDKEATDALTRGLIDRIERGRDEVLASAENKGVALRDMLTLSSIECGSFTRDGAREMLVLVKVNGKYLAHPDGFDRTIAAIFAQDSSLLCQTTFAADNVFVTSLDEPAENREAGRRRRILYIGRTTYTGMSSYDAALYEVTAQNTFERMPLADVDLPDDCAYTYGDGALHVFTQNMRHESEKPFREYVGSFYWDNVRGVFTNAE